MLYSASTGSISPTGPLSSKKTWQMRLGIRSNLCMRNIVQAMTEKRNDGGTQERMPEHRQCQTLQSRAQNQRCSFIFCFALKTNNKNADFGLMSLKTCQGIRASTESPRWLPGCLGVCNYASAGRDSYCHYMGLF